MLACPHQVLKLDINTEGDLEMVLVILNAQCPLTLKEMQMLHVALKSFVTVAQFTFSTLCGKSVAKLHVKAGGS